MLNQATLLKGIRFRRPTPAEPWQRVPKVNLLDRPKRAVQPESLVRWGLALVILVFVFLAFGAVRGWNEAGDDIAVLQQQLVGERSSLALQTSLVDEAQEQIAALEAEREAAASPSQALAELRLDWESALSTLFAIDVEGVTVTSVTTRQIGDMRVDGTATTVTAMEAYRGRLRSTEDNLVLRSFNWSFAQRTASDGAEISVIVFSMEMDLEGAPGAS